MLSPFNLSDSESERGNRKRPLSRQKGGDVCASVPSPSLPPARAPMGSRGTPLPLCPWPPDLRFLNYMQQRAPDPARTNVLPARPSSPVPWEISSSQGFPPGYFWGLDKVWAFQDMHIQRGLISWITRCNHLLCVLCVDRCPGVRPGLVSGFRNTQDCKEII